MTISYRRINHGEWHASGSAQESSQPSLAEYLSKVKMNYSWYGKPVEEVDPLVFGSTFCVISKRFKRHHIYRFSNSKSLFLFGPLSPIRKSAIYITTNPFFDLFMLLTIAVHIVTLALHTNRFKRTEPDELVEESYEDELDWMEIGLSAIYILEMILKIIAKGLLLNKFAYLRSKWSIIDFITVVTGIISIALRLTNALPESDRTSRSFLEFFQTLRAVRIVKALTIFTGIRLMIKALIRSVVRLVDVLILILYCLLVFSVLALDIFQGRHQQKCVIDKGGIADPNAIVNKPLNTILNENERNRKWTEWVSDWTNWKQKYFPHKMPALCGNASTARQCGEGYTCIGNLGHNPDNGWIHFDNIGNSMLTTFQVMTTDNWEEVYAHVISTSGAWALIFCITAIFMGFYYLLNLLLAVVIMSYENEVILKTQGPTTATAILELHRKQSTFSFDQFSKLNVCKINYFRVRTKSESDFLKFRLKKAEKGNNIALYHYDKGQQNHTGQTEADKKLKFDELVMKIVGMREALELNELEELQNRRVSHGVIKRQRATVQSFRKFSSFSEDIDSDTHSDPHLIESRMAGSFYMSEHGSSMPSHQRRQKCRQGMSRCLKRTGKCLERIVEHKAFERFITGCIILNTILMAAEHHEEPRLLSEIQNICSHVFLGIFTVEVILKSIALQKKYFTNRWHQFDLALVIISYVDLVISVLNYELLKPLRCFRLLRVFKLAHSWATMRVLLNIIFSSLADLWSLTCVLVIVLYIFSVTGMALLGGHYSPGAFEAETHPTKFPSWHWGSFPYSFMMVFRVLCGEWIEPLLQCLRAQSYYVKLKTTTNSHWMGDFYPYCAYGKCFFIYFLILVIGNFILLNLFLALLLNRFDAEELTNQRAKEKEEIERHVKMTNIIGLIMQQQQKEAEEDAMGGVMEALLADFSGVHEMSRLSVITTIERPALRRFRFAVRRVMIKNRVDAAHRAIAKCQNRRPRLVQKFFLKNPVGSSTYAFHHDTTPESSNSGDFTKNTECCPTKPWMVKCCRGCKKGSIGVIRRNQPKRNAWTKIRELSFKIVHNKVFDCLMFIVIMGSSILLCFEDHTLDTNPQKLRVLCTLNHISTGIFTAEMILKCIGLGIYRYITNLWTILDGFLVVLSLVIVGLEIYFKQCSLGTKNSNLDILITLRALRALRPIRAVSRMEGMKIIVSSLVHAIPAIFNVLLVCLVFWLIFAVIAVQLFKGKFFRCVNMYGKLIDHRLAPDKITCCAKADSHEYSWTNPVSHYDNVFNGYLSLFQIATFEGWMEIMSSSVSAVGVDKQPILDYDIFYYIFYLAFITFGSFFTFKLFISVVIDNFNVLKKRYEGNALELLLTPSQRNYYIAMRSMGHQKPRKLVRPPKNKFRCHFYYLALSKRLEAFMIAVIITSIVTEMFNTKSTSTLNWFTFYTGAKACFTALYIMETLIKVTGLGGYYFTKPWNVFDCIIGVCAVMESFANVENDVIFPIPPVTLRMVRILHVGRLLHGVKRFSGIRKLLFALTSSLPAIFNIGALLGLVTFVYAVLGMALFMDSPRKWSIDELFNFDTFFGSCLLLFRLMTLQGWNEILDSLSVIKPVCGSFRHLKCGLPGEPKCPRPYIVIPYLVSFLMLTNQIIMNLFCAIILENFIEASDEHELGIVENDVENFYLRWSRYDQYATQFIDFDDLSDFLDCLNPPFRIPKPNTTAIVIFDLPIARGNKIHCLDILHALIRHILGEPDDSREFRRLQRRMEDKFHKQFKNRNLLDIVSSTRRWKIEYNAVIRIQRLWRRRRAKTRPDLYLIDGEVSIDERPVPQGNHRGGFGCMIQRTQEDPMMEPEAAHVKGDAYDEVKEEVNDKAQVKRYFF